MARIPEAAIEQLKQTVSLQRLAEARGIVLKRHGADLLGLCPFHDDKEPSLVISPKQNLWHCLGACQRGGSVIDWVMQAEGVSFRHAVELLQTDYQPLAAGPVKRSTVPKLPTTLVRNTDDARLLNQVIDYYHATLKQSPEALAYLEKRGLNHPEVIAHFKLGFANRTLGYRLPAKNRKEGAALRGQLQRIGLMRPSGHEHFTGSLVIPVIDETGQVQEVYGRKINDNLREGTPLHLYLPGPHQGVWNLSALQATKEIILCESLIDALTFWCAGYRNVTASYGVEGFTAEHLAAFKRYGIERVLIAYDRDGAGDQAAGKLAAQLLQEGLDCYRIEVPKGMDINDYARHVTPATKSLGVVIRSALWLGQGQAKALSTEAVIMDSAVVASMVVDPQPTADPESTATPPLAAPTTVALPATVIPERPAAVLTPEVQENALVITLGDRRYRIRGLEKNLTQEVMKINLLVSRPTLDGTGQALHVDTFDLYQQRPRSTFIQQAAVELGVQEAVIKRDLGQLLLACEALQVEQIQARQAPRPRTVTLNDDDTQAALELLRSPDLLLRIQQDFSRCGVIGEETNKLIGYLATLSRKLEAPLAVIIQSTSAAGKSSLMDAVLGFIPEEERIKYSAMTGQSLFYMGETDLQHKVLAIVEEEGALQATYALKLLQSEGELTIASTGKDPQSGELKTQNYQVKGPVMILLTTTVIDIDEELLNRCLVLSVDEGRAQTQAIHALQRDKRTLQGLLAKAEKQAIQRLHQNAQRLLQPLAVVNPYARQLSFIDDRTRTRRDHEKYLTLIDSLALLHQHQRPIKTVMHHGQPLRYVEVILQDIETANRLAHDILGRTLDELPPQTRKLLHLVVRFVTERCATLAMKPEDVRFSRRELRTHAGWGHTQLRIHLVRLVEMEYLLVHRGGRGQSFVYELLYDGNTEEAVPHLSGLIDSKALKVATTTGATRGETTRLAGTRRGQDGQETGTARGGENGPNISEDSRLREGKGEVAEKTLFQDNAHPGSYGSPSPDVRARTID
jgi:DNA primase catalytic core